MKNILFAALLFFPSISFAESYSVLDEKIVIRASDKANIPMDEQNRDYKEFLRWVEDGGAPSLETTPIMESQPSELELLRNRVDELEDEVERIRIITGTKP